LNQRLETFSKAAAAASAAAITALQIALHPDATPALQALAASAALAGWLAARASTGGALAIWLLLAIVSPAPARLLFDREGPVLEIFWMAGLTAALLRTGSWRGWALPAPWRVLAGGWALLLALAWPVLILREARFSIDGFTDLGAINAAGSITAPHAIAWILYVVWTQILGLLWLDRMAARAAAAPDLRGVRPPAHAFWIGSTVASVAAVYQGVVDIAALNPPFWSALGRAGATMNDPNLYGTCAALAAPLAFVVLSRPAAWTVAAVNLTGLWMTGARTPLLLAAIAMMVVLAAIWRTAEPRVRHLLPVAVAGLAAVVALAGALSSAVTPLERLRELPEGATALSQAIVRGPYGTTSLAIMRDFPAVGVGLGSYQLISPDYWRIMANDALPFDNAQNWWRHQATELGLAGSAIPLACSALLAWLVLAAPARAEWEREALVLRGSLAATGICALIQMRTDMPIVLLWFWLLVACLITVTHPLPVASRLEDRRRASSAAWVLAAAIALAYATAHLVLARGALDPAARASRGLRDYVAGAYPEETDNELGRFRWTRNSAVFVRRATSRWLALRLWASHPDIADKPVHLRLSTPCGLAFERDLRDTAPVNLLAELPDGLRAAEWRVDVSRTWRPADEGLADPRDLGIALFADFLEAPHDSFERLAWPRCGTADRQAAGH
jgi:hypothetical protein